MECPPISRLRMPTSKSRSQSLSPINYAYHLLARRAHSEKELTEKLLAGGFTAEAVTGTIAQLRTQGYLDDNRLAADQVERLRERGFGPEGIKNKLVQKGLSLDIIEQVVEIDEENKEQESARRLLASRFSADALKQSRNYARAFRFLLRRGYSQAVIENLLGSEPPEDA